MRNLCRKFNLWSCWNASLWIKSS